MPNHNHIPFTNIKFSWIKYLKLNESNKDGQLKVVSCILIMSPTSKIAKKQHEKTAFANE